MNTKIRVQIAICTENPNDHITVEEYYVDCAKEYALLKLSEGFTKEDLERAYKKALIKYHPDKPNGDKEKFEQSTEAYLKFKDILWYRDHITQR